MKVRLPSRGAPASISSNAWLVTQLEQPQPKRLAPENPASARQAARARCAPALGQRQPPAPAAAARRGASRAAVLDPNQRCGSGRAVECCPSRATQRWYLPASARRRNTVYRCTPTAAGRRHTPPVMNAHASVAAPKASSSSSSSALGWRREILTQPTTQSMVRQRARRTGTSGSRPAAPPLSCVGHRGQSTPAGS
jgi:hypothetical protein